MFGKELFIRCNICDRLLSEPVYNSELKAYEPCHTCLDVIEDTIAGYGDRPSADEDDFGEQLELPLEYPDPED